MDTIRSNEGSNARGHLTSSLRLCAGLMNLKSPAAEASFAADPLPPHRGGQCVAIGLMALPADGSRILRGVSPARWWYLPRHRIYV